MNVIDKLTYKLQGYWLKKFTS